MGLRIVDYRSAIKSICQHNQDASKHQSRRVTIGKRETLQMLILEWDVYHLPTGAQGGAPPVINGFIIQLAIDISFIKL